MFLITLLVSEEEHRTPTPPQPVEVENQVEREMTPEPPIQPVTIPIVQDDLVDEAFMRSIAMGEETVIKIEKGTSGLGLSIVGGSDTLLVSCPLVSSC